MSVYEKRVAIVASLLGFQAFRELLDAHPLRLEGMLGLL
jgi:hypothetical protein